MVASATRLIRGLTVNRAQAQETRRQQAMLWQRPGGPKQLTGLPPRGGVLAVAPITVPS
jgi:hypothetical protein